MVQVGPVGYMAGALGAGLVVAAVANRNPLDVARQALTGSGEVRALYTPPAPEGAAPVEGTKAVASSGLGPAPIGERIGAAEPGDLVQIGQGNHRLRPEAAAAFQQWETLFGSTIRVTDTWRSYDHQARQHRSDPDRFASPDRSWHVRGLAVDVNLGAVGVGSTISDAGYRRLYDAARAAGWDTYTDGVSGHTWHFSYGGRG